MRSYKKMLRVRNNLFYLFFINNTRRYRLNENTDNTNNFPQIAQIYTDSYLRTRTKGRWPKGKAITRIERIYF